MMLFKKKKQEQVIKKPIYKQNNSSRMITIICPYCGVALAEVYCMKINDVIFDSCLYCNKQIDM